MNASRRVTAKKSDVLQIHSFLKEVGTERSLAGVTADNLSLWEDVFQAYTVHGSNLAEELVKNCLSELMMDFPFQFSSKKPLLSSANFFSHGKFCSSLSFIHSIGYLNLSIKYLMKAL